MTARTFWLASYPKSGNTWFRAVAIAWQTAAQVDINRLTSRGVGGMASSRARIEAALGVPTSLMTADEVDALRPRVDEVALATWAEDRFGDVRQEPAPGRVTSDVRMTKIHDALFDGPTGEPIVSLAATRGAFYIVRDPRDVAVSYAHHNGWSHERVVETMERADSAMSGGTRTVRGQVRQRLGTWSDHVRSWLDQSHFPVHVVRYEDCHADPVTTFTAALQFAGFAADPGEVAAAVDAARFERLTRQEDAEGFRERSSQAERFFRRGTAGTWRDELAPELAARIVSVHGEVMERLGYACDES